MSTCTVECKILRGKQGLIRMISRRACFGVVESGCGRFLPKELNVIHFDRARLALLLEIMAFSVAGFPVLYVLATTVLVIILVRIVVRRPTNLPPGPTGLPLLGSLHLLIPLPHQSLAELAKKYGPLMSLRLGQSECIVASSPATAMEFLKKQDANFCGRAPVRAGKVLFGPDILFQDAVSPKWRLLRKIFHMELTGMKRLEPTRHVREEEMTHLLRTLPRDQEFELRSHLTVLLSNIISRLVLNRRFSGPVERQEEINEEQMLEIQNFQEITEAIPKCLNSFYPADFIPALKWFDFQGLDRVFKETNKRMEAFATKIISEHQEQRQRGPVAEHEKDMVHILLDEVDHNGTDKSGPQITMDNVKGIMWDAFAAATDTITMSCEWIISEVVSNPTAQSQAQAELDTVLPPHRRVQESDLPHLPYLLSIVKEGLRLHPPAPMLPHQAITSYQVLGYDIPAQARLFVNVWAIGRDPLVWEDPMKFNPDRWLGKETIDGSWLPFGAGRRICPGMALANVAMQYCIASLLQAFEWEAKEDPGREEGPGLSVPRAVPLRVVAKRRQPAEFYN